MHGQGFQGPVKGKGVHVPVEVLAFQVDLENLRHLVRQGIIGAGCLNRVAGRVMREVQRATRSSMLQCLLPPAANAEPIPELEFDQTMGW